MQSIATEGNVSSVPLSAKGPVQVNLAETDLTHVRRLLDADPVWAVYALADLQPALVGDCRWLTGTSPDGDALVLLYQGLQPPVLFTLGQPAVLAAVLAQAAQDPADLPHASYVSIREEHLPVVAGYYDLAADTRPMRRMVLVDPQAALRTASAEYAVSRLNGTHVPDVQRLLARGGPFTPDAFSPSQVDAGVFYGVFAGAELLAVGGTHVVDFTTGIAAIGNMYTHPDHRRRGHSAAVLRAIVRELLDRNVTTIVLNVDQRNPGAQALYLAHGFIVHVPYVEGKGNRNVDCVL
jgi:ribosomal protein S18 acetylase RimI-like enzyme